MQTKDVALRTFLEIWVNSERNHHFAVVIKGAGGSGKTHFVKTLMNERFAAEKIIYLSLLGYSDDQQLRDALRSVCHAPLKYWTLHDALVPCPPEGLLPKQAEKKAESATSAPASPQEMSATLVIFDDIERCKIPPESLFGVINHSIENTRLRVVLLTETDNTACADFQNNFEQFCEKNVGHAFLLESNIEQALHAFIKAPADEILRTSLEGQSALIKTLYGRSGAQNLHRVKKFIWWLEHILSHSEAIYLKDAEFLSAFIQAAYIFFFEYNHEQNPHKDPQNITRHDLKKWLKGRSISEFSIPGEMTGQQSSKIHKMLEKYVASHTLDTVLSVEHWLDILDTGFVDPKRLNDEIADIFQNPEMSKSSWRYLWNFDMLHFSERAEKQFWQNLEKVNAKIEQGHYTSPRDFLHVAALLCRFCEDGIQGESIDLTVEHLKHYIDTHIQPSMSYALYRQFYDDFVFDPHPIIGAQRGNKVHLPKGFLKVRDYLLERNEIWYQDWKSKNAGHKLLHLMKTDFPKFFAAIVSHTNIEAPFNFRAEPVLEIIDGVAFVDGWLEMREGGRDGLYHLIKRRYEVRTELILAERTWWEEIKTILDEYYQKEASKLRRVQIRETCAQIDKAIKEVVPA